MSFLSLSCSAFLASHGWLRERKNFGGGVRKDWGGGGLYFQVDDLSVFGLEVFGGRISFFIFWRLLT